LLKDAQVTWHVSFSHDAYHCFSLQATWQFHFLMTFIIAFEFDLEDGFVLQYQLSEGYSLDMMVKML